MSWVFVRSRSEALYTVGFYTPDGDWEPESDHSDKEEAAKRVAYLNGVGLSEGDVKKIVGSALSRHADDFHSSQV